MNTLSRIHTAAAGITLFAGLFALTVRIAPILAPTGADAALTQLALILGEDLTQPVAAAPQAVALRQPAISDPFDAAERQPAPRIVELTRPRHLLADPDIHLATFGTPAAQRKVVRVID